MNATAKMDPSYDQQVARLGRLLQERGINGYEIQRALDNGKIVDGLADILRIIRIPETDMSSPLNEAAMKRVVNQLFRFDINRETQFDGNGPWYADNSTGFDPSALYDEINFRLLLEGMPSDCLTVLVMRAGLLSPDGEQTPAGMLAQRYKVPAKDIATLLKRANKHIKAQQREARPFFHRRPYHYDDLWKDGMYDPERAIIEEFGNERFDDARVRLLNAGITTVGELVALPKRRQAELLVGPDKYLPLKWFPRYVHV